MTTRCHGKDCECISQIEEMYLVLYFYDDLKGDCCPQCECIFVDSVGNIAEYPENYTSWNCTHCHLLIGEIDNSPFSSIWDWDEDEVKEAYAGIIEVIDTM